MYVSAVILKFGEFEFTINSFSGILQYDCGWIFFVLPDICYIALEILNASETWHMPIKGE